MEDLKIDLDNWSQEYNRAFPETDCEKVTML